MIGLEYVRDLSEFIREQRPFSYVLQGNPRTGQRTTLPKKNKAVIAQIALIGGDIIHNLRAALDHAYWEIVSPFAKDDRERRKVQFPFVKSEARLEEALKDQLADRVSPSFFKALLDLKPYSEPGGNELLFLIEELDILDKHKLLIPIGDYTKTTAEFSAPKSPNFPVSCTVTLKWARMHGATSPGPRPTY